MLGHQIISLLKVEASCVALFHDDLELLRAAQRAAERELGGRLRVRGDIQGAFGAPCAVSLD